MQIHYNISQMFKRITLHVSQNRMLLLAILISLILHSFVLTTFSISLPKPDVERQMLEMHLVKLPAPIRKQAPPLEVPPPTKKTKPRITPPDPEPLLAPIPAPADEIKPIAGISAITESLTEATPSQALQEKAPTENETSPTEYGNLSPVIEENVAEENHFTPAYRYTETVFEVRRGNDTSAAGESRVIFNITDSGTYTINSTTQAKGLAALFFGTLIQISEGTVTDNGLVPLSFSYQYGNDESNLQSANFAWSESILYLHSSKGNSTEPLVSGTQDLLSFMYQFMFMPPLNNLEITLSDGKKLRTYTYSFEGEALIPTKMGELNTIHLLKSGREEEKTELWLALDYQYLPIKIRKTEKDGSVIEQTATQIITTPFNHP